MGLGRTRHLIKTRIKIIKSDLRNYGITHLFTMLKMWCRGFSYEKYLLYNLTNNNPQDYLSDIARAKTRYINPPYQDLLNNKILFEKVFSEYIRIPKNYCLIEKGKFKALQTEQKVDNIDDVNNLLRTFGSLVVKPVCGGGGKGVSIIKITANKLYLNNKVTSWDELNHYLLSLDNYLIMEYIKQGSFSESLSPESANTMRIIMMVDKDTNEPFIAGGAQRIGSSKSNGKDNFALGGFSAGIDIDSGELSKAVSIPEKGKVMHYNKHPETNAQIAGLKIPNWLDIKEKLIQVMKKVPYIKYIGWDIILTDNGIVAIEGNNHPEPRSVQAHQALLKLSQVKKFYQDYHII
jgi:hypothetical protein